MRELSTLPPTTLVVRQKKVFDSRSLIRQNVSSASIFPSYDSRRRPLVARATISGLAAFFLSSARGPPFPIIFSSRLYRGDVLSKGLMLIFYHAREIENSYRSCYTNLVHT